MRPAGAAMAPETWLFLVLGAFAVAVLAVDAPVLPHGALVVVLAIAVALTGLPHGALDPWIAWRVGLWHGRRGFVAFHLAYIGLAALVVVVWQLAPGASLAMFLAISAWHFAGDWRQDLPGWARAVAGLALLALPAWRWPAQVDASFALLAGADGLVISGWLGAAAPWLAVGMAAAALLALRSSRATAMELAAVAALALLLPPLVYFIVYFCALHSLRHLRIAARGANTASRRRMASVAALYTALTLVLAAVAWPWLTASGASSTVPGGDLLKVVFIGLAALTLPHMLVVLRSERAQERVR